MLRWCERPIVGAVLVATACLVVAGCESSPVIPKGKLDALVLSSADVPTGFSEFSNGAQVRLDNQGTVRSDTGRYGREGGWIARYRRSDTSVTTGALVIESRADLFKDSGGAKSDLGAYRTVLSRTSGSDLKTIPVTGLGEEATGITFTQPGGRTLRYFRIVWRYRNATASLTVEGFDGEVNLDDALSLARKQQHRIEAA
jgi:hypothetical protein